jgi:hypothetical protein
MLRFECGDMGDGCEDVGTVRSRTLDAVSMIDTSFTGLMIYIKVLEIVVKVDGASTEISSKQCCVCGEYRANIDMTFATKWNGQSRLPLVEVGYDSGLELTRSKFSKEPGDEVAKYDGFIAFVVIWRGGDTSEVPKITFPFIEAVVHGSCVEEKNARSAFDQPPAIQNLDSTVTHGL